MGDETEETIPRPERRRRRRSREFVDAAQHIIALEGFEGLTMSRLARELDTVDSAVYRYFPSKGALIAEIQKESIERLEASLTTITATGEEAFTTRGLDERTAALARLVLFGRWLCAASDTYPDEMRLLQLIMSQKETALDPEGGFRIFPIAMQLVAHAITALETAQNSGAIGPGNSLDRAIIWSSSISGVLQTDDLEKYAPELFGSARLARQTNLVLLAGFGADEQSLDSATDLVDQMATAGPLAP
jgi:AcrR family transcriptional regulator